MTAAIHYVYRDRRGHTLYRVVRYEPKRFAVFDRSGRQLDSFPALTVLYRLPEIVAAEPNDLVFATEGEKDADRLIGLGLIATTNPGGCRLGWKEDYNDSLRNRRVIILADHDRPGARHAERVEQALIGTARAVAILKLPRLRRAEDVSDWLDFRQGTSGQLVALAEQLLRPDRHSLPPAPPGGHAKRHSVFSSRELKPNERLLILALQHVSGSHCPATAKSLATATGLHRVTVQRLISQLGKKSLLTRCDKRLEVCWDRIAAYG
jgi:Helix-turn-helix domain